MTFPGARTPRSGPARTRPRFSFVRYYELQFAIGRKHLRDAQGRGGEHRARQAHQPAGIAGPNSRPRRAGADLRGVCPALQRPRTGRESGGVVRVSPRPGTEAQGRSGGLDNPSRDAGRTALRKRSYGRTSMTDKKQERLLAEMRRATERRGRREAEKERGENQRPRALPFTGNRRRIT